MKEGNARERNGRKGVGKEELSGLGPVGANCEVEKEMGNEESTRVE